MEIVITNCLKIKDQQRKIKLLESQEFHQRYSKAALNEFKNRRLKRIREDKR